MASAISATAGEEKPYPGKIREMSHKIMTVQVEGSIRKLAAFDSNLHKFLPSS